MNQKRKLIFKLQQNCWICKDVAHLYNWQLSHASIDNIYNNPAVPFWKILVGLSLEHLADHYLFYFPCQCFPRLSLYRKNQMLKLERDFDVLKQKAPPISRHGNIQTLASCQNQSYNSDKHNLRGLLSKAIFGVVE